MFQAKGIQNTSLDQDKRLLEGLYFIAFASRIRSISATVYHSYDKDSFG